MNTCDDCGRPGAELIDIHDGAQLCRDCANPYDTHFHRDRLRRRLPLTTRPSTGDSHGQTPQ